MENSKPEEYKEIDIRCPQCDSDRVVVCEDSEGHFQIIQCHNCGYKKSAGLKNNFF